MFVKKKVKTLLDSIKKIIRTYKHRGFTVHNLLTDNEFLPLEGALADMGIILNKVTEGKRVLEIENFHRTAK